MILDPTGIDYLSYTSDGDGTHSAVKAAIWPVHMQTRKPMSERLPLWTKACGAEPPSVPNWHGLGPEK